MELRSMIKDVREAKDNNKLVVFVGNGVSRNSNTPKWADLITAFAKELNHTNCSKCNSNLEDCPIDICEKRYSFSQDEYLKIPQYYYSSLGSEKYYKIIQDMLDKDFKPNALHDIIMKMMPKHIITTNYDRLIENTSNLHSALYSVIKKDEDLLISKSNNYIIKMHGDIRDVENIVLKETDYLSYEQNHPFIQAYIKALLIDHTFLFVGYSLNDYNLKLILNWIEYYAERDSNKKYRPKYYIIECKNHFPYESKYYESKNIYIINGNELYQITKPKYDNLALQKEGKLTYNVLDFIMDEDKDNLLEPLVDLLAYKYQIFSDFERISFQDILSTYNPGVTKFIDGTLIFYDEDNFNNFKQVIKSTGDKQRWIKKILRNAGICAIQYKNKVISFKEEDILSKTDNIIYFNMALDNKYNDIMESVNSESDDFLSCYYNYFIGFNLEKCRSRLSIIEIEIDAKSNIKKFMYFKFNHFLISISSFNYEEIAKYTMFTKLFDNVPKEVQLAFSFLKSMAEGMLKNQLECNRLLYKHEQLYISKESFMYGNNLGYLPEIKTFAYDYYYYFKLNGITVDYLKSTTDFFEPYIRAILCTYSPKKERPANNFMGLDIELDEYVLNSIDFDILVKYSDTRFLKHWVYDYKVEYLKFENEVMITLKFINLCESIIVFEHTHIRKHLVNFLFILTKCDLTSVDIEKIINAINALIKIKPKLLQDIYIYLHNLIRQHSDKDIPSFKLFLDTMLSKDIMKMVNMDHPFHLPRMLERLSSTNDEYVAVINSLIETSTDIKDKLKMVFALRYLFDSHQRQHFMNYIKNNISHISPMYLYSYIVDKDLAVDERVIKIFTSTIDSELMKKEKSPGVTEFPDKISQVFKMCIDLHITDYWKDISCLKKYESYSVHLKFLLNPTNFGIENIDIADQTWMQILKQKKYFDMLTPENKVILAGKIKKAINNDYADNNQKLIYYRYLMEDEELWF